VDAADAVGRAVEVEGEEAGGGGDLDVRPGYVDSQRVLRASADPTPLSVIRAALRRCWRLCAEQRILPKSNAVLPMSSLLCCYVLVSY
jgi:hypothetical protein